MDTEKLKSDLTSFFNEYEFLRKEKDELNQTKLNRRHEIMNNLFIEWDEELKDSYYRKSYNQGIIRLVNMGLCCGVCGYSRLNDKNQCVCVHPIHRNTLHDIEVEPYQICELVTLGNKYLKFIFDGNSFKRRNPGKSTEKEQERLPHVGFVMREEHYEDLDKIKEVESVVEESKMSRKPITEDMNLQDEWFKKTKSMKPDDFPEFFREMTEDYIHDYGTVCHAMAAVGLAAMFAFNNSDGARGGITGFQAGCVMWEVIRHMNYENNKCGLRLLDMDNLLYPQYEYKFHSIDSDTWKAVQKEAKNRISESKAAHEKYLKEVEQYKCDLDKFKKDVKDFESKHPEYPKYEDDPKFYEHLGCGTAEEWDREKEKEESGFLFAPRKPYDSAAHPDVVAHWESIVNGKVPFGLRIED